MNNVVLMGRITKDIEVKYSANNIAMTSFSIAVNRKYVKEGEERQADFIMCKAFGKTAENISKFFGKGSMIAIDGRIQTGSYEKEGQKIYTTDVIVDSFYFTGSKNDIGVSENSEDVGFKPLANDDELPF